MKSVYFTDVEWEILGRLLDVAVKAAGLNCVKEAAVLLVKLDSASNVEEVQDEAD